MKEKAKIIILNQIGLGIEDKLLNTLLDFVLHYKLSFHNDLHSAALFIETAISELKDKHHYRKLSLRQQEEFKSYLVHQGLIKAIEEKSLKALLQNSKILSHKNKITYETMLSYLAKVRIDREKQGGAFLSK